LAVDLGASSGRVILGTLEDGRLALKEIHRFDNGPVRTFGRLFWNIFGIYQEILCGLRKGAAGETPGTVGIDTWGVDFGLLDSQGLLVQNPFHYRDPRTDSASEEVVRRAGDTALFRMTGVPNLFFNTSVQLVALAGASPELLPAVRSLAFIPDLLNYFLTGVLKAERTIAGTSQLLEAGPGGGWSDEVFRTLGLTHLRNWFPELIDPGTVLGPLTAEVREQTGLPEGFQVVAVASHDTESATVAVPFRSDEGPAAFISCGTWALMGVEGPDALVTEGCRTAGLSNEAAANGKTNLLKNIMGLWILQECRRWWEKNGALTWEALLKEAEEAPPQTAWIDPDSPLFVAPDSMPDRIGDYLGRTGQPRLETRGALVRCILESLAFRFRETLDTLENLLGYSLERVHLIGGGCQNPLLCQWTAEACRRPVEAGPAEASALGNLLVQFIAAGRLASLSQARELVRTSFPTKIYQPSPSGSWEEAYLRFQRATFRGRTLRSLYD
jgi:rhamnulokinase